MSGSDAVRIVSCPSCRGPSRYAADNPFRPFCSERCRNLDLGAWANEQFRVGVDASGDDADPPAAPDAPGPH